MNPACRCGWAAAPRTLFPRLVGHAAGRTPRASGGGPRPLASAAAAMAAAARAGCTGVRAAPASPLPRATVGPAAPAAASAAGVPPPPVSHRWPGGSWRGFGSGAAALASEASGGVHNPAQLVKAAQEDLEAGVTLMEEGHVQLAMDKFQNSILLNPTALAYYNQGVGYYSQNDVGPAIKSWEKAIAMQPDLADAYCNLANAYVSNLKDTKQALDHISTAARLSPTDPEIQFNYGLILDRAGRLEEAVKQYNVAKALGVAKAEALARNAGARLLAVKQPDDAVGKGGATTTDNEGSTK